MAEIEIFLSIDETHISFLSIPRNDIERLAKSPFRWIRYVMFAICGVGGELSTTPNGPAVDYENTETPGDEHTYYYRPSGQCVFVDHQGLDDRRGSTAATSRCGHFRDDVIQRDGHFCVITQKSQSLCDAAHLIPHSKSDEYIRKVMRLRAPEQVMLRDNGSASSGPKIDITENGIFLSKDVHSMLGIGDVAFIQTPNYGLGPEHIKTFSSRGGGSQPQITLQWIKKPENFDPQKLEEFQVLRSAGVNPTSDTAFYALQNVDALFRGDGARLPFTFILDYLYGIAAYKAWCSTPEDQDGSNEMKMKTYHNEHYANIESRRPALPDENTNDTNVRSEPEDPKDPKYGLLWSGKRYTPTGTSGLEETMDELNRFFMRIYGITPEMAAEREQKEIELEERATQEASRSKVMEWRNHLDVH